jgi:hypothetical protein
VCHSLNHGQTAWPIGLIFSEVIKIGPLMVSVKFLFDISKVKVTATITSFKAK